MSDSLLAMRTHFSSLAIVIALSMLLVSCTSSADQTTTTTTVPPTTTSTTVPPTTLTTTTVPPTTTTKPLSKVDATGDMPAVIATATSEFLSVLQDPRNDPGKIDAELVEHHAGVAGTLDEEYTGTATIQELSTGGAVGVVVLDNNDLVLVADDGDGWSVVGARLTSLGAEPWFGENPRRILVLGSDARPGGDASVHRMDSIHILTSVADQETGTILGYPRDTWIDSDYGSMRINALPTSGRGPEAIFDHFTEEWKIPLEGYILTGFAGFTDLIDAAVGRLQIVLPRGIPLQTMFAGFRSGEQTLTPIRTLDYSRARKGVPGGDLTRSSHHGVIMKATLTMLQDRPIDDLPMLLGELVKYTESSLSPSDLVQLGTAAWFMDIGSIDNLVLPGHVGRAGGGQSVVLLDQPEADAIVADVIDDGLLTPQDD